MWQCLVARRRGIMHRTRRVRVHFRVVHVPRTPLSYLDARYQEMIAHRPLASHPCPRRVLVVGGGDGGVVRKVLKHRTVEVVLCDIDEVGKRKRTTIRYPGIHAHSTNTPSHASKGLLPLLYILSPTHPVLQKGKYPTLCSLLCSYKPVPHSLGVTSTSLNSSTCHSIHGDVPDNYRRILEPRQTEAH